MRGKWWIALLALVAFPIASALMSTAMEKRYTASMKLLVDTSLKGYDQGGGIMDPINDILSFTRPRSIDTHVQVLMGSDVLAGAIERTAQRFPKAFAGAKANEQYENLVRRIGVETSPLADVITIRVTMLDPAVAAETANNIGFSYIDYTKRLGSEFGDVGLQVLKSQISSLQTKLNDTDNKIKEAKVTAKVIDPAVAGTATSSQVNMLEQKFNDVMGTYEGAKAELASAESSLQSMDKTIVSSEVQQYSPMLQDIEVNLSRAESELQGARARYLDDHPIILDLQARIAQQKKSKANIQKLISAQTTKSVNTNWINQQAVVAAIKGRVAALERQLSEARTALATAQTRLDTFPEVEQKLANLTRQRTVLESSLLQLDQRRESLESMGAGRQSVARIVSPALPPAVPSFPDMKLFILIGLAIGVIVAALIIMPKGDQDIYGQWNQKQDKQLRGRQAQRKAAPAADDRPAMPSGDGDNPPSA